MPETATSQQSVETKAPAKLPVSFLRQAIRFVLHLCAVYLIAAYGAVWTSGFLRVRVLPLFDHEPVSSFQFFFSHLFALDVTIGFIAGLANAKYRHRIASYVWIVPTAILAYKLLTFGPPVTHSVLAGKLQHSHESAFHHYFASDFLIAEYHSYKEMFEMAASNPDVPRGVEQLHFVAPFYAGVSYCIATFIAMRLRLSGIRDTLRRLRRD